MTLWVTLLSLGDQLNDPFPKCSLYGANCPLAKVISGLSTLWPDTTALCSFSISYKTLWDCSLCPAISWVFSGCFKCVKKVVGCAGTVWCAVLGVYFMLPVLSSAYYCPLTARADDRCHGTHFDPMFIFLPLHLKFVFCIAGSGLPSSCVFVVHSFTVSWVLWWGSTCWSHSGLESTWQPCASPVPQPDGFWKLLVSFYFCTVFGSPIQSTAMLTRPGTLTRQWGPHTSSDVTEGWFQPLELTLYLHYTVCPLHCVPF